MRYIWELEQAVSALRGGIDLDSIRALRSVVPQRDTLLALSNCIQVEFNHRKRWLPRSECDPLKEARNFYIYGHENGKYKDSNTIYTNE